MKGTRGATGESRLENHKSNFSRNQTDEFDLTVADIGAIEEVTVRLSAEGLACVGAPWHFREIEVKNLQTGGNRVPSPN